MNGTIDIAATKIRFKDSGRKYQAYAMAKGFNPSHWAQKMAGHVKFTEAELESMMKDDLLVMH